VKPPAAALLIICLSSVEAQSAVVSNALQPLLRTNDVAVVEGTGGVSWARFTATLDAALGHHHFVFASPMANGTDVVTNLPQPTGFDFAPGQLIATCDIPLQADALPEPDEAITVIFANYTDPNGPSFERSQVTLTIINDDIGFGPVEPATVGEMSTVAIDLGNPLAAGDTLTVTSVDPNVLAVEPEVPIGASTGVIRLIGLRGGNTTIVADVIRPAGPAHGEVNVTVFQPSILVANPAAVRLRVGEETTLHVSLSPAQGIPTPITVQSSSSGIVEVLDDLVTAPAGGDAVVTLRGLAPGKVSLNISPLGHQQTTVVPVEVIPSPGGRRRAARP
jgi:hypothetical protein